MPPRVSITGGPENTHVSSPSSRHSVHFSTGGPSSSGSRLTSEYGPSASTNSRINPGSRSSSPHISSGNHRSKSTKSHQPHPYHEARGKSRPSLAPRSGPMDFRIRSSGQMLFYFRDSTEADRIVEQFREKLTGPLGLDIEYKPKFTKGGPPNKTALVQLASESVALLVQVSAMSEFPHGIKDIIENPTIVKAGVGIQGDVEKLWKDFGVSAAGCLELGFLARAVDTQWASSKGLIGLARLVKAYENRDMKKPKRVQMSNWEIILTEEQQDYAADDANAGLTVLQKLYAILPAISPAPAEALYLFCLSQGRTQTVAGASWPPPAPSLPKEDPTTSPNVSVVTSMNVTKITA